MNKYNLESQLATKSEKQVIALRAKRISSQAGSADTISKYEGDYRYDDSAKHQAMVKNAHKTQDDCYEWLKAAIISFSAEVWDKMVVAAGGCLECFGYEGLKDEGF